jgi:hypothetical protein
MFDAFYSSLASSSALPSAGTTTTPSTGGVNSRVTQAVLNQLPPPMAVQDTNPLLDNAYDTKISQASAQYNSALAKARITGNMADIRAAREAAEDVKQIAMEKEVQRQKDIAESSQKVQDMVKPNESKPPPKPKTVSASMMPDDWYDS